MPVGAGVEPLLAARIVTVGIGAAALAGVYLLLARLEIEKKAAAACLGSLGVVILSWAVGGIVPDLLTVALGLFYLRLALASGQGSPRVAVAGGLVAGVAYLAKAAFLPFFVLMTVTLLVLHGRRDQRWRRHLSAAGCALVAAGVLVLPWAATISTKYDKPTIGTSASYNLAIIGPGSDSLSGAHPQDTAGLLPPPTASATSAWTDPTLIPVPAWSPLSVDGAAHEARNIALNLGVTLEWIVRYWVVAPLVVVWALSRFRRGSPDRSTADVRIVLAAAVLMAAVYLPLLVESRYLWLPLVLLPILGAVWWTSAVRRPARGRALAVLAVASALLLAQPVHHLVEGPDPTTRETLETVPRLRAMGVQGTIASDANWSQDLFVAYHRRARYYGTVAAADPDARKAAQLRDDDIRYFLLHTAAVVPDYLHDYVVVGTVPGADLTVLART